MKKKNSSAVLWVALAFFGLLVTGFSLRDQGFFNRAASAPEVHDDHAGEGKADPSELDRKREQMMQAAKADAPDPKGRAKIAPPSGAPRATSAPTKPKPNDTSTGSQWYADEAAKKGK